MQKASLILAFALSWGCKDGEEAELAIARSRHSAIDQVNPAGRGIPFFAPKTLNPSWSESSPIVRVPPLQLTDHRSVEQTEKLFQGKTSIVAFIFTSCSGFCPFVVQELKKVERNLASETPYQYVLITVDPEFDTPARLKTFAEAHGIGQKKNWHLLTGPSQVLTSLIRDTFASQALRRPTGKGRDFVHSGHFYVIDSEGRLRGILNGTDIDVADKTRTLVRDLTRAI